MAEVDNNKNTGARPNDDTTEPEDEVMFGVRHFRPKLIQFLRRPFIFVILLIGCLTAQIVIPGMLMPVGRTLQRRFHLTKRNVSLLTVIHALSAMVSCLITGHLGGFRNKVRWICGGMLLTGIGSVLFAMPHYRSDEYVPLDLPEMFLRRFGLCGFPLFPCKNESVGGSYMALFVIGQILIGSGLGPLYSLVPTYIDENVRTRHMPIYLTLYYVHLFIGPILGMGVTTSSLNNYVDINQPSLMVKITTKDFRWIGAWWLTYVVFGILVILNTFTILMFPKRLPGARSRKIEDMQKGIVPQSDPKLDRSFFGIFHATGCLLTNKVFVFNTLAAMCISLYMFAVGPFLIRIIMIKYGADPVKIGLPFGLCLFIGLLVGFTLGGILLQRLSLKDILKGAAFLSLVTQAVCLLTPLLFVIPGCNDSNIAGVTLPYPPLGGAAMLQQKGTSEITTQCNAKCNCSTVLSTPVCGENNVAYFDPCHAGCINKLTDDETFVNCTCIPPTRPGDIGGTAKLGFCDRGCKSWRVFLFVTFVALAIFGTNIVPSKVVILRCVPYNLRSYGLALQSAMVILVGLIPEHILQFIMDKDCNIRQTDPCGVKGICWDHKAESMSKSMTIFGFVVLCFSVVFYSLSWYNCGTTSSSPEHQHGQLLVTSEQDGDQGETAHL